MSKANRTQQIPLFDEPGITIEAKPGESVVPLPAHAVPKLAISQWVPAGDGTYRPVASIRGRALRLNAETLDWLKLPVSANTIKRLIMAGFMEGGKVTPNTWVFDPESYLQHQANVFDDEEFWDKDHPDQNLQRWRETLVLIRD